MSEPATRRCWRFSPDCPKGRIFTGADAIAAAEADGWVDSPAALGKPKPAPRKKSSKKTGGKKVATSAGQ